MASKISEASQYLDRFRDYVKLQNKALLMGRPHGYNPRILVDINDNNKYVCGSCKWILRQPIQSFCGHRFCTECFKYILSTCPSPVKCQLCVDEGTENEFSILKQDQTFPDNGVRRELYTLAAICVNPGCDWKGTFKEYLNHEGRCVYKQVQCEQCGSDVKPEELVEHQVTSCPVVMDKCIYCNTAMKRGELKFHDCYNKPVTCPGCGSKMSKKELLEHSDPSNKHCNHPSVPCVFGCSEIVEVTQLKYHLNENLDEHICELNRQVIDLERLIKDVISKQHVPPSSDTTTSVAANTAIIPASFKKDVKKLEKQVDALEVKYADLLKKISSDDKNDKRPSDMSVMNASGSHDQKEIALLDKKIHIFERVSAVFKREIEKCGKQIDNLIKDSQESKSRLDEVLQDVQTVKSEVQSQKTKINELTVKLQDIENLSYDGILFWKILDFHHRRQQAINGEITSFYSRPFYTSRTGYKACARIYLNGDGMGKNTHVSLFFVLMRGEFDALLPWPFQQKVTMTWLDQLRREDVIDSFRPDPTSNSFRKPTSDMNIASGCPLFMKLSTIEADDHAYVKEDTAFIKITIDTKNLESF